MYNVFFIHVVLMKLMYVLLMKLIKKMVMMYVM